MLKSILKYGVIAGLVVGGILFGFTVSLDGKMPMGAVGMAIGYASMLLALSAVFVGIKAYRDRELGGVIRFWPAFGMGVGITLVAGVFYVLAWEAAMAVTGADFAAAWTQYTLDQKRAEGASEAELAKLAAEMADFGKLYANRWIRMAMSMTEILPVGVLVSAISAGLLRRPQFMPARAA